MSTPTQMVRTDASATFVLEALRYSSDTEFISVRTVPAKPKPSTTRTDARVEPLSKAGQS